VAQPLIFTVTFGTPMLLMCGSHYPMKTLSHWPKHDRVFSQSEMPEWGDFLRENVMKYFGLHPNK
jgi:hypothetical protein